ncbi:MAG: UPF0182 family protein [Lachnospiraceae bacterium]|nr:UPF0182 family protein [Lachnospiraceae bacterium]
MQEKSAKNKAKKRLLLVIAFLILFAIFCYVWIRGEYLQVLEIGEEYTNVYVQSVKQKVYVFAVNFLVLYLVTYTVTRFIKRGLKKFFIEEKREMPKLPNKSIALIISSIAAIIFSEPITEKIVLAINSGWFGQTDPIFGHDIGYFMFQKPAIEYMLMYFIGIIVALTIYTVAYYIAVFNIHFPAGVNPDTLKKNTFIKQILVYIGIAAVIIAALVFVKTENIVFDKIITLSDKDKTSLNGGGLAETTIKLWGYRIFAVLIAISIFNGIKNFKRNNVRKIIISLGIIPVYIIMLLVVILGFDLLYVGQNQLDKEKEYINYNIKYTQNAYGINIEEVNIENSGTITLEQAEKNKDILNNISLVTKDITLSTLEEYQTSLGYYTFTNTKIGLYDIDGENKLVYVSPREIINTGNTRTYNNKTYEYTHGFGVVLTSATSVDEMGGIEYVQKSFDSLDMKVIVKEPRIYFGLKTKNTVVTNAKNTLEYDYPTGTTSNSVNEYNGTAGLKLNFLDRLILGITKRDVKLAFATNVTNESKILTNRSIIERAETIMPYLEYDENPYMVIRENGDLVWVLDAYTMSNNYPYAQETTLEKDGYRYKINYIRNSVKVIINAYTGEMKFYITDKTDPMAMAYRNIYKGLFIESDIPDDIEEHMVYSEYIYNIQANMINFYHEVQPEVLYRVDDVWEIVKQNISAVSTSTGTSIKPYYTMLKTVDSNGPELGLVIPYTKQGKQNIISYLVGTYDKDNKSKLTLYKFETGNNVLGPVGLDTQIEEDDEIYSQIEAVNVTGTRVTRNMIIVPIDNTLLYVEPIYQVMLNDETQVPILKKVVLASGSKVAIGNNLEEALSNLLSQYATSIEVGSNDTVEGLIQEIVKAEHNLRESENSNDWELIGKDIQKLHELIQMLEQLQKENLVSDINTTQNEE